MGNRVVCSSFICLHAIDQKIVLLSLILPEFDHVVVVLEVHQFQHFRLFHFNVILHNLGSVDQIYLRFISYFNIFISKK